MTSELMALYQKEILAHSRNPHNFLKPDGADSYGKSVNTLCGDACEVYLKLDGDLVISAGFQGVGCAICKASASMMTDLIIGKTNGEIRFCMDAFEQMIMTGQFDETIIPSLKYFSAVHLFPGRTTCALLPWRSLAEALPPIRGN